MGGADLMGRAGRGGAGDFLCACEGVGSVGL